MGINMKIHNIKSIDDFEFDIPTQKGLYAITGENGVGKSTIISCAATAFYNASLKDYFGKPRDGASIEFSFNGKVRKINATDNKWNNPSGQIDITGFYEGSIVFGNRFKDIDFRLLDIVSSIKIDQVHLASDFVIENLGKILHDDEKYYKKLYVLNSKVAKEKGLQKSTYYYENKGTLISQLNMSTGENLLLSILYSLEKRVNKKVYGETPAFMLLDEIELALHSSALRRLIYFLKEIADKHNTVVLFSTHSIELIRSISPENIFYLQGYVDGSVETINPCYPIYATRNLESSNYGHDCIVMVEDDLAKQIVDKILRDNRLLSNKRVLVIGIGGWQQVLRFAYDTIRSNLALKTTKIITVLDRDIKSEVNSFLKKEHINFTNPPQYLPIKSLEKYLLDKLTKNIDHTLFRELNDYVFQSKSLDQIIKNYNQNVQNGIYKDAEKIKNGKMLYSELHHELEQIRKTDADLISIIVEYLFKNGNAELNELIAFFESEFK